MGVDVDRVRSVRRVPADGLVSGVLGRFLRRPACRHERRIAGDGCDVPLRKGTRVAMKDIALPERGYTCEAAGATWSTDAAHRAFADAVRYYLQLSPRQLPSRFLYDTLGSA